MKLKLEIITGSISILIGASATFIIGADIFSFYTGIGQEEAFPNTRIVGKVDIFATTPLNGFNLIGDGFSTNANQCVFSDGLNESGAFVAQTANGTHASPTAIPKDKTMAKFCGEGYNGSGFLQENACMIIKSDEAHSIGNQGARFEIFSPPIGSNIKKTWISINELGLKILEENPLSITEGIGNTPVTREGQFFFKNDGHPYIIDSQTGDEERVRTIVGWGELYLNDNAILTDIHEEDEWHAIGDFSQGLLENFIYTVSDSDSITAFADAGDGQVTVTSAGHGLSTDTVITIVSTTNYDGIYQISNALTDTFEIEATWVATETGDWDKGTNLQTSVDGNFAFNYTYSLFDGVNKQFRMGVAVNDTIIEKCFARRSFGAIDTGNVGGTCFVSLEENDIITLLIMNLTDSIGITVLDGNFNVHNL